MAKPYLWACAAAVALAVCMPAQAQSSKLKDRALQCAAFNLGSWDYEAEYFSEGDRSDAWKEQAAGFADVAHRAGAGESELSSYLKRYRGAMKQLAVDYVFSDDRKRRRSFDQIGRQCDRLIRSEPELSNFR